MDKVKSYTRIPGGYRCAVCNSEHKGPFALYDAKNCCLGIKRPEKTPCYPVYQCSACQRIYYGSGAREEAAKCCIEVKPWNSLGVIARHMVGFSNEHPERKPGEGTRYPYPSGHYYRGHNPFKRSTADYHRAFIRAWNNDKRRIKKALNEWFKVVAPPRAKSAEQALSYAFTQGLGWEAVKSAAYALAFDKALQRKLDELNISETVVRELQLQQLFKETYRDGLTLDREQLKSDIQSALNRIELETFIDGLNVDDFERGDDGEDRA